MPTNNNAFDESDDSQQEESGLIDRPEDRTLRQETAGAVGAVGAVGNVGAGLPGSGTYVGGATLFGLTAPFGRGTDSDGRLAESAELALAEEPRLTTEAATGIRIEAAFGVLELSGEVPTEADREIAEEAVSQLAGVSAVENKLQVKASG
jgi:osmotically-inducible protein OsmY